MLTTINTVNPDCEEDTSNHDQNFLGGGGGLALVIHAKAVGHVTKATNSAAKLINTKLIKSRYRNSLERSTTLLESRSVDELRQLS